MVLKRRQRAGPLPAGAPGRLVLGSTALLASVSPGCSWFRYWDSTEDVTLNRYVDGTRDAAQETTVTLLFVYLVVGVVAVIRIRSLSRSGPTSPDEHVEEMQRPGVFVVAVALAGVVCALWAALHVFLNPFSGSGSFTPRATTVVMAAACAMVVVGLVMCLRALGSRTRHPDSDGNLLPLRATLCLVGILSAVWVAALVS